jgi:hypothetical protein
MEHVAQLLRVACCQHTTLTTQCKPLLFWQSQTFTGPVSLS